MYGFTPMCFSLWTSLWWSTLSNALLKPMAMTSICWHWSKLSAITCVKQVSWVSQLCFDLNPLLLRAKHVMSVKVIHHVWHIIYQILELWWWFTCPGFCLMRPRLTLISWNTISCSNVPNPGNVLFRASCSKPRHRLCFITPSGWIFPSTPGTHEIYLYSGQWPVHLETQILVSETPCNSREQKHTFRKGTDRKYSYRLLYLEHYTGRKHNIVCQKDTDRKHS